MFGCLSYMILTKCTYNFCNKEFVKCTYVICNVGIVNCKLTFETWTSLLVPIIFVKQGLKSVTTTYVLYDCVYKYAMKSQNINKLPS